MGNQAMAISGFFNESRDNLDTLLLVACILIWLAYLALRYSRKLQIPVITAFLVLGLALGPSGLGFINSSMMSSLRIIEPIALGVIAFAAGERLRIADLGSLSSRHYLAIGLQASLPVVIVTLGAYFLTGRIEIALPMGAIAGTTGLATVIHTLKESGAEGAFSKTLGAAAVIANVFCVLYFSLTLPFVAALVGNGTAGSLYLDGVLNIAASIALGLVAGILVSRAVRSVRAPHELSMFVLAYVLLLTGVAHYLQLSVLLAGLSMGAAAANLTRDERDRDRVFVALSPLEYPVFSIFFLWAGASLHIGALGSIGWIVGIYLAGRAFGKIAGPLVASIGLRFRSVTAIQFRSLGIALLPQAGAAVGLAVIARDTLPQHGEEILATVLGAVVIFELVGPLGVHWAARRAGEVRKWSSIQPLTLQEAIKELESRKPRVVVLKPSFGPQPPMEAPQRMAARLHADLIEIGVSPAPPVPVEMIIETAEQVTSDRHSAEATGLRQPTEPLTLDLDHRAPDALLESLKTLNPDMLFLSLPRRMRDAMGSVESLATRVGCPVIEISPDQHRQWVDAVSSRLAGADEAMARMATRFRQDWQPRIMPRLAPRGRLARQYAPAVRKNEPVTSDESSKSA